MMALRTIFYGFCIHGFFLFYLTRSDCSEPPRADWHGTMYARRNNNITQSCTWTILPPANRTDLILSLKLIHYYEKKPSDASDKNVSYTIILPDGSNPVIPQRHFNSIDRLWCGLYVKEPSQAESSCRSGLAMSDVCLNATQISQKWPAQISTEFKWFFMILYYEFIDCSATDLILPTPDVNTPTTLPAAMSMSYTRSENATSNYLVSTSQLDQKYVANNSVSSLSGTSELFRLLAVSFGTIFTMTIIVLIIVAVKYWTLRSIYQSSRIPRQTSSSPRVGGGSANVADFNLYMETGSQQTLNANEKYAIESNSLYTEIGQPLRLSVVTEQGNEPVDDLQLNGDALQRSELVDNVLYGCTSEKEEVVNELYNI